MATCQQMGAQHPSCVKTNLWEVEEKLWAVLPRHYQKCLPFGQLPVSQSFLAQTPIMVIVHNKYQGMCCNGWQVTPILTSALVERPPVLRISSETIKMFKLQES
uniref:Uncharacterized protein n=1 Tax=Romanomermis culicivorax TaxID=13658 RepID=A0A915I2K1_ROMCU